MGLHSRSSQSLFIHMQLRILQGKVSGLAEGRSHVIYITNSNTEAIKNKDGCLKMMLLNAMQKCFCLIYIMCT